MIWVAKEAHQIALKTEFVVKPKSSSGGVA
jgi:hypothetical protein